MILQSIAILALLAGALQKTFDVATIKPSSPDQGGTTFYVPSGGRFGIKNITLKDLVAYAWNLRDFQISGGPGWVDSTRYDVVAQAAGPAPLEEFREMLQPLLTERFRLELHRTSKDPPFYVLAVGKNEAKLQPSQASSLDLRGGKGPITGRKIPLSMFTARLAESIGRPVIDRTGLKGDYDINLQWTPDDEPPSSDPARPSIFTAVPEQLGLRLESQRGPVEILIIDRAERPTEN